MHLRDDRVPAVRLGQLDRCLEKRGADAASAPSRPYQRLDVRHVLVVQDRQGDVAGPDDLVALHSGQRVVLDGVR